MVCKEIDGELRMDAAFVAGPQESLEAQSAQCQLHGFFQAARSPDGLICLMLSEGVLLTDAAKGSGKLTPSKRKFDDFTLPDLLGGN